ncbi:DMT family transporter [Mycolicibacterium sp. YH-1]|uniref:DMT family transporter n=1 Tax=Mycolicibacterium sp. YH-1 TaxID=2908837 RepID=UPI001F4BFF03|nr:DMT family transporter [Mycolicibacterium sp. YH-1]UNB52938.1 DMT family transporter [Mycolicibacterium sp. YH-1]
MRGPRPEAGVVLAITAAASFGISGPLLKPMIDAGWSPSALVIVRSLISALVLLVPGLYAVRGRWSQTWHARYDIAMVGLIGVAASQLAFAQSLKTLPVGTAILIQYSAPVVIVLYRWIAGRAAPSASTMVASCLTLCGLFAVASPNIGNRLDLIGVLWATVAMVTVALYYVTASRVPHTVPAISAVVGSQIIGAAALLLLGSAGIIDMTTTTTSPVLQGQHIPWWLPITTVGVIATALGFWASIAASRVLGSQKAAFFGTLEVAVAVTVAWLALAETPTAAQIIGGVFITAGVATMRTRYER